MLDDEKRSKIYSKLHKVTALLGYSGREGIKTAPGVQTVESGCVKEVLGSVCCVATEPADVLSSSTVYTHRCCGVMANIFVGNLSYFCTHVELAELFATAVPVVKASIRRNKEGDSRHFGFVEIESEEDAENAIAAFDGVAFMGRILRYTSKSLLAYNRWLTLLMVHRVKSCHSSLQDSPTSPRCDQIQIHVSFLSNKVHRSNLHSCRVCVPHLELVV